MTLTALNMSSAPFGSKFRAVNYNVYILLLHITYYMYTFDHNLMFQC